MPWEQQPALPPSRNLSSIPSPVVIEAASPGSLRCSQGWAGRCPSAPFVPSFKSKERIKEGSGAEPWKAPPLPAASLGSSWPCRQRSVRLDRRSMTDGGTQLEPERLSLSPPSWVTNTSQRAEPIQELLVLLQVHFPARPTTSSSAGRHRGTHKLRPLSAAQHSRWTPLSRPLTTGSVSLFDEAHESLPGLRPPPFFCK